jgi:hypothetical protein
VRHPSIPKLSILALLGWALGATQIAADDAPSRMDQVLDAIVANERELAAHLDEYDPLLETYLQTVKPDVVLGTVPVRDNYFIGRLVPAITPDADPSAKNGKKVERKDKRQRGLSLLDDFHSRSFKPELFARMLVLDRDAFDREHYDFEFLRAEFLGEIRTLVFDVTPKPGRALDKLRAGRFTGRVWVEDRDYNIVRYNGIYDSVLSSNFHFDSWRIEMAPGTWLPAYVYTEEAERAMKQLELTHRGQTRIWGYSIARPDADDEFTKVLVEAADTRDGSETPGQISPVESARIWESEAEENVLRRLERAGLLAPPGEVDKVLETVVANLEITNNLTIDPPVRCRVLLTTPIESFTVGHTIVVSRGLLDVLPDEASLAMMLAHELGHVLAGHELDTRFAFTDQILVDDAQAMDEFLFVRDAAEEAEADTRAVDLLRNSPYKDDLGTAGLFLKALSAHSRELPALIRPHFGNRMANGEGPPRMAQIADAAPELKPASIDQIAALPLGGRVKLDPWSAEIALMKNNRVALLSAREKLAFQVTPLMPYLARHRADRPVEHGAQDRRPAGDARQAEAELTARGDR